MRHALYVPPGAEAAGICGVLVALYILLLPIQIPLTPEFRLAPSDFALALCLLFGLGRIRLRSWAWSPWHWGLVPLFAMGTLVTAITWGSVRPQVLFQKDVGLLLLLAGYVVIADWARSWERIRQALRLLVTTVALNNLVALADFCLASLSIFHLDWLNYGTARLAGLLVDPNAYGGLLILALLLHLSLSATGEIRHRWAPLLNHLTTLSLTAGVLLTFSRSAWIGLCLATALALFLDRRPLGRLLPAGLLAGALILLVLGPEFRDVIITMSVRPSQVESRLDYIFTAIEHLPDSPLWGLGLGFFATRYGWIIHNTAIWFLAEFGLIGFTLFSGFSLWFGVIAWHGIRRPDRRRRPLLVGLLLGHAAMLGLSLGIEALYQRHWWLVMALIAASRPLTGEEQNPQNGVRTADSEEGVNR